MKLNDSISKMSKWRLSMSKKKFITVLASLLMITVLSVSTSIVRAYTFDDVKDIFSKKNKTKINFGSVDVARLRKELTVYKQAEKQLKAIDEEYSEYSKLVLVEQNKATAQLMREYEIEKAALDREEALNLLEVYNQRANALAIEAQNKLDAKQKELNPKRAEIEADARSKVKRIVREVAQKEGVRHIIDKKSGLYIRHDITDKVIEAATKQEKKQNRKRLFGK